MNTAFDSLVEYEFEFLDVETVQVTASITALRVKGTSRLCLTDKLSARDFKNSDEFRAMKLEALKDFKDKLAIEVEKLAEDNENAIDEAFEEHG